MSPKALNVVDVIRADSELSVRTKNSALAFDSQDERFHHRNKSSVALRPSARLIRRLFKALRIKPTIALKTKSENEFIFVFIQTCDKIGKSGSKILIF
jgi:hypothetical protein